MQNLNRMKVCPSYHIASVRRNENVKISVKVVEQVLVSVKLIWFIFLFSSITTRDGTLIVKLTSATLILNFSSLLCCEKEPSMHMPFLRVINLTVVARYYSRPYKLVFQP